jgi:hypothetical protein
MKERWCKHYIFSHIHCEDCEKERKEEERINEEYRKLDDIEDEKKDFRN